MIKLTPEVAADLMVGDLLLDDGRELLITKLIPATAEEALAAGKREVQSLMWWRTYDATEPVKAAPGRLRLARIAEQDGQVSA
ncbi:hypothetical protein ACIBHX_01560 [Nonomuraea sp. NPDC050536]|uniref:hypothetical protein n=1 Tax=Nonomuraea sp. NPDC050536 TaxID=3364366 RepID=UPI0037C70E63